VGRNHIASVTLGVEFGQMGGQWFELEDYYCDFLGGLWYNFGM